jgi:4-amino-4-deoxy-L-arabinose transferase-like glycosyltransferase
VLLAIFLDFFQLGQNRFGNLYYAAGVRSMLDSWHNFFFVSLDPGGFVTIDKPPLGFWLQTLSARLFGFTAFSLFLPQALCGVLAVLLLYALVRRHFGVVAGLVAALALALTPITVVTVRNNTIDGTLALALLLAAWAVIHAAETGKLRWLLLSAVFVGLGFNIKMAEAYLVVPALVLTYLLCAPRTLWTRLWHLALAGLVVLLLSLSWAATVDLVPASARPYVGSTQNNSELSLAFGYNGLSRLHIFGLGGPGFGNAFGRTRGVPSGSPTGPDGLPDRGLTLPQSDLSSTGAFFQFGMLNPFNLFSVSLGGQIAWLLPLALLGIVALAWQRRWRFQQDRQQLGLLLWGFWLLTMAVFFTLDSNFHQYYMTEMAPGLCAMAGIGLVTMWRDYRRGNWRGWLLPLALLATAGAQLYLLASYPTWAEWMSPLIGGVTALVVLVLILGRLLPRLHVERNELRLLAPIVAIGLFALLLAPAVWSGYSVFTNAESAFPTAGPNAPNGANSLGFAFGGGNGLSPAAREALGRALERFERAGNGRGPGGGGGTFPGGTFQIDPALTSYLEAHQGNTKFLVATPNATTAEALILATNRPVMAMGGFSGNDPILTTDDLQSLIRQNIVHFFLLSGTGNGRGGGFFGGFGGLGQSSLSSWVVSHCSPVPPSTWNSAQSFGGSNLYACSSGA